VVRENLQFSKTRLTDFGELPQGEIPQALQYDFKSKLTKLDNGMRVVTEEMDSNMATATVLVRAGSRNETLETSGVSQYIKQLILRGTKNKQRAQLENELQLLGGNFDVNVGRETTTFSISTRKG
jgi:processing peptidase subunit beta